MPLSPEIFDNPNQRLGATHAPKDGVHLQIWAPAAQKAQILWTDGSIADLTAHNGYFRGHAPQARPGDRYWFVLDGEKIPDPASRFQPEGSFGPSAVVDRAFAWTDTRWRGCPFSDWVIYEIHAGAYSSTHDFDGIIADLPRLKALGITTIELMPVAQFSGTRNWGYDGVFPHAVQNSYGGPEALKRLVDACHAHGLAIILDVVFNHLGPEGNVLFRCGPYASDKYRVPWGQALNFDGPDSDHVRRYFLQTVWQWLTEYHFDGLRLDAIQMIFDNAAVPFLQEVHAVKSAAETLRGYPLVLIGETDMNDCRCLLPPAQNGFGMDAHWADDFHHALHATLTGERDGYYADYGGLDQLARIYERGVAFEGEYSPYRRRRHGRSYANIAKNRLIVEAQNHDQTGNRLKGERLISLVGPAKAKLAAACVLLSPFTPFLFMGEEWGCRQPFLYFISHASPELLESARRSRREEWASFGWAEEPPDPAAPATFSQCVLNDKAPADAEAAAMTAYYRALIHFSKQVRTMQLNVTSENGHLKLHYHGKDSEWLVLLSFKDEATALALPVGARCLLCSEPGAADTLPAFGAMLWQLP